MEGLEKVCRNKDDNMHRTLHRKSWVHFQFLGDHLENLVLQPRFIRCDTLTPKELSSVQQNTNPLIARPLSEKS